MRYENRSVPNFGMVGGVLENGMVLLNTAMLHQIRCVKRGHGALPHQRISHIGGGSGPSRWLLTVQQAIRGIEDGSWLFCVLQDDRVVPVVITAMPSGEKYLKTATDEEQPELLLALVECSPWDGPPPASADCESPRD